MLYVRFKKKTFKLGKKLHEKLAISQVFRRRI